MLFTFFWYQLVLAEGVLSILYHEDFVNLNYTNFDVSWFFVGNFLLNYGLGWFFVGATISSLLIIFIIRKRFLKILIFDLICLITIAFIVFINTFLGAGLNLRSPYCNTVKYCYQSLPFFSLLAASLASKCFFILHSTKLIKKPKQSINSLIAFMGLFLLAASILVNIVFANFISRWDYLLFRAEMNKNVGYSLFNPTPIEINSIAMILLYLGFGVVLFGLLWESKRFFVAIS